MTPLAYTLVALATYRVATDIAWEDGPFAAFVWLRGRAMERFGGNHWIADGLCCPICLSFWIAPLALSAWVYAPWLVMWLAVAGGAALLARWQ